MADAGIFRADPKRRPLCDLRDSVFLHQEFDMEPQELRTGAAITVVANAPKNVDADAGSICYVATVIDAPVLTPTIIGMKWLETALW